jgi:hemerythrin-like domain-containing protein
VALKRHPALQDYSREHHEELLFVWKIKEGLRKAIDAHRINQYVIHQYQSTTALHMAREEKYILTKLPENDIDRIRILNDHAALEGMLKKITGNNPDPVKLLSEFAEALENHIRFEERIFFPKLQNSFSEDMIHAMQPAENNAPVNAVWDDPFWIN